MKESALTILIVLISATNCLAEPIGEVINTTKQWDCAIKLSPNASVNTRAVLNIVRAKKPVGQVVVIAKPGIVTIITAGLDGFVPQIGDLAFATDEELESSSYIAPVERLTGLHKVSAGTAWKQYDLLWVIRHQRVEQKCVVLDVNGSEALVARVWDPPHRDIEKNDHFVRAGEAVIVGTIIDQAGDFFSAEPSNFLGKLPSEGFVLCAGTILSKARLERESKISVRMLGTRQPQTGDLVLLLNGQNEKAQPYNYGQDQWGEQAQKKDPKTYRLQSDVPLFRSFREMTTWELVVGETSLDTSVLIFCVLEAGTPVRFVQTMEYVDDDKIKTGLQVDVLGGEYEGTSGWIPGWMLNRRL